MSQDLMETGEIVVAARSGGILNTALPAPEGWMQGLALPFNGCGEPVLQDRCAASVDTLPDNIHVAEFHPFGVQQSSTCSSLSRIDQSKHAEARLDSTTEWAVARQLATDGLALGTPSFADGTSLGVVADGDFVLAVGTLEQAAADEGFGTQWWLHAPVKAAAFLTESRLMLGKSSPSGAPWVVSVGYPVQGATTIRLWATGSVWAGVEEPFVFSDLDRRTNGDEAFAQRSAIVAFDPCINLFIDVTVPASPVGGP
jgi:hypothetical protein